MPVTTVDQREGICFSNSDDPDEIHLRKEVNPDLYFITYAKINFRAKIVPNVEYKI